MSELPLGVSLTRSPQIRAPWLSFLLRDMSRSSRSTVCSAAGLSPALQDTVSRVALEAALYRAEISMTWQYRQWPMRCSPVLRGRRRPGQRIVQQHPRLCLVECWEEREGGEEGEGRGGEGQGESQGKKEAGETGARKERRERGEEGWDSWHSRSCTRDTCLFAAFVIFLEPPAQQPVLR